MASPAPVLRGADIGRKVVEEQMLAVFPPLLQLTTAAPAFICLEKEVL